MNTRKVFYRITAGYPNRHVYLTSSGATRLARRTSGNGGGKHPATDSPHRSTLNMIRHDLSERKTVTFKMTVFYLYCAACSA